MPKFHGVAFTAVVCALSFSLVILCAQGHDGRLRKKYFTNAFNVRSQNLLISGIIINIIF